MQRLVNCRIYAFDPTVRAYRVCDEMLVGGTTILALGSDLAGATVETVDLGGATVVPAFADCHLHLTDTGLTTGARDLAGARDEASFAEMVAALPAEEAVYGANYDESRWRDGGSASAAPLEHAFADRLALLVRIDGHSCLINRRTFLELDVDPSLDGVERDDSGRPTGRLFRAANWTAQQRFFARIPEWQRRAAERSALALAQRNGAVHLHVQLVGMASRDAVAAEIEALRALGGAKWHFKICEPDPEMAASFGLRYVGGDVFLDGSLGSGTAALAEPYADRQGCGDLRFDDAQVHAYFSAAERFGVAAGVHAIGDRAIEQCLRAWERVAGETAAPGGRLRERHFIEHVEVASRQQLARAARLGLFLSVQPQFDAEWGGAGGMYERRLGEERARSMNALRTALSAGAILCGGDDSPVCALSPLRGMAAACAHHVPEQRLEPLEALTMYAYDAARLAYAERTTGALHPGFDADFVALDRDPFAGAAFEEAEVLQTWLDGKPVYAR